MFRSPSEENVGNVVIDEKSTDAKPKVIQFNYTWVIKYFSFDTKYESPVFSPECNENLKWYLKLTDSDNSAHKAILSDNIVPSLCLLPCIVSNMTVKYKLTIRSPNTYADNAMSMMIPPTLKSVSSMEITEYGAENSFSGIDISRISNTGRRVFAGKDLTIFCAIDLFMHSLNILEYRSIVNAPRTQSSNVVQYLLNDAKYSDVTINVCGQEFSAHKAILAVRSRVFSAMFEHEMAEKQQNLVNVKDVEPEVFRELLGYIYTGQSPNIEKMADKLLMAAEKYDIEELKHKCAMALCANLTIEKSADILIIADVCNIERLKLFAAEFINFNLAAVLKTEGFQSMIKSHPEVMADVLRAVADTKRCGTDYSLSS